jgi:hypothetical protein
VEFGTVEYMQGRFNCTYKAYKHIWAWMEFKLI